MTTLADLNCRPYDHDAEALPPDKVQLWQVMVPKWTVLEQDGVPRLERVFRFPNFTQALLFADAVGFMAEEQNHHPALLVEWGRVTVHWWTHKVDGLHFNDFIAAAKTDRIYDSLSSRKTAS